MAVISQGRPLALCQFLGSPVLDHALKALAEDRVTHVTVVVAEQFCTIERHLSENHHWGLSIELVDGVLESLREAGTSYDSRYAGGQVYRLEALPQAPLVPLFESPAAWHRAHTELASLLLPQALGMREINPGVWVSLRAVVSPQANLKAPCWIGSDSQIGAHAIVGPNAIVESGSFVDTDARIIDSTIAESTYVGSLTEVRDSVAVGASLLNWRNGSCVDLADRFLLAPMSKRSSSLGNRFAKATSSWWARRSKAIQRFINFPFRPSSHSAARRAG